MVKINNKPKIDQKTQPFHSPMFCKKFTYADNIMPNIILVFFLDLLVIIQYKYISKKKLLNSKNKK